TLVRNLWHVDARAGASASTKLDVYNPVVGSAFQVYDCGGDDDSAVGRLASTLRQMSIASSVVLVVLRADQCTTKASIALLRNQLQFLGPDNMRSKVLLLLNRVEEN